MFCKYLKINNTNCHNALIKFFNQNHESALFHCQASADLALCLKKGNILFVNIFGNQHYPTNAVD